jgi:transcriptional regulator with XRE-family HTH domain
MLGLAIAAGDINIHAHYRPVAAVYKQVTIVEGRPLPSFGGCGTGGVEDLHFARLRQGYSPFTIINGQLALTPDTYAPYTDLMKEIKAGFGRTMSHLPAVFGVSRQTLYNWLNGEAPREQYQVKLIQLASAARVFTKAGFKPTALSFERIVAQGKSFVELMAQGADGKETAELLLRIEKRGVVSRAKLDALLGDRESTHLDTFETARIAFNENV